MKKLVVLLLLVFAFHFGFSQHNYRVGMLPALTASKKIGNTYKLSVKVESRSIFSEGVFSEEGSNDFEYSFTDIATIVSKKAGVNNKIAAGYNLRVKENEVFHRLIQQFTLVQTLSSYRIGHRFAADETFSTDESTLFRLRYRMAVELPLNGQTVDPKEAYIKLGNEYLNSFQSNDYDLEIRLIPVIGYVFADKNRIEGGLNYRFNGFINNATRSSFWLVLNWYIGF